MGPDMMDPPEHTHDTTSTTSAASTTNSKKDPVYDATGTNINASTDELNSQTSPTQEKLSDVATQCWHAYRDLVRKHGMKIGLVDEALNRLLFWLPHRDNTGQAPPWREMVYGLLSVHRLAMHCSQEDYIEDSFGTTLLLPGCKVPAVPATSIRIALSVLHCLMPSMLELASSTSRVADPHRRDRRQSQMRLRLEQVKFLLRLYLLYSYWKQHQDISAKNGTSKHATVPGLLLDGGLFHANQPMGMPPEQAQYIERRRQYVGRRTGIRLAADEVAMPTSNTFRSMRLKLGEFLYILRPACWAAAEAHSSFSGNEGGTTMGGKSRGMLMAWAATFLMDVTSLGLIGGETRNGNPLTMDEYSRRKKKLLLYLLRSPVWSRVSQPCLDTTSSVLHKIPLLGTFLDALIWDWILYWKHPYIAEEG
eukprot:Nitzschia sp. Nitz4//scaffold166_size90379//36569//37831//NITZ4_005056-RA/size90379-processed-gene-0.57-mRNA-1//-1//CDS//3329538193//6494//frame0